MLSGDNKYYFFMATFFGLIFGGIIGHALMG